MKVISGIVVALRIQGSLSAFRKAVDLLSGKKSCALASEDSTDNWLKTPENVEAVINDALDRNSKPTCCKYTFNSILVMANEAAHNFHFVEYAIEIYSNERKVPGLSDQKNLNVLQDLKTHSQQILTLVKQKLLALGSTFPSIEEPKINKGKTAEKSEKSMLDLSQTSHHYAKLEKTSGFVKKGILEKMSFTDGSQSEIGKWPELEADPKGLTEPLLGTEYSEYSLLEQDSEEAFPSVSMFQNQIICEQGILHGLRDCMIELSFQPPSSKHKSTLTEFWRRFFEESVFKLVEFMLKYQFIDKTGFSTFYESQAEILEITRQHIENALKPGNGLNFPRKPEETYQMMDSSLDYMRHSLGALKDKSQRKLIHGAFSSTSLGRVLHYELRLIPPCTKDMYIFMTCKDFLVHLESWKPGLDATSKSETLKETVAQLISNISDPPKVPEKYNRSFSIEGYRLNVIMLDYITQNIPEPRFLDGFFPGVTECDQFKSKFNLLVNFGKLTCLHLRWMHYVAFIESMDEGVISKWHVMNEKILLENEVKPMVEDYHDFQRGLRDNEKSRIWQENEIIQLILYQYSWVIQVFNPK